MSIFGGGFLDPDRAITIVGNHLLREMEALYERKYGKLKLNAYRDGFNEAINCLKDAVIKLREDEIVDESERAEGEEAERNSLESEGESLQWEAEDDSEFEEDI